MAELSLSLPVKGEEAPGADAKVNAAFTEIQTQFNGKVAAVNLEAAAVETAKIKAEAVTGPKLGAETVRILAATKYEEKSKTKAEIEAGFEFSATRMALVFSGESISPITIEGIAIPGAGAVGSPYLVPPGQKVKGSTAKASITFTLLLL